MIIAGLVAGLLVGWHFIRKFKREYRKIDMAQIELDCPKCRVLFKASESWTRDGLRGSLFNCFHCGADSWWDMQRLPPKLRSWH